jgi:hypothetical protein
MVHTNLPCRLCVGVQGIGSIPLDGLNAQAKGGVGGGAVPVFRVRILPLAKTNFILILTL